MFLTKFRIYSAPFVHNVIISIYSLMQLTFEIHRSWRCTVHTFFEIESGTYFREVPVKARMSESLVLRGTLRGHKGWVTQLSTSPKFPDMILSASRDKSLIIWKLTRFENSRITSE